MKKNRVQEKFIEELKNMPIVKIACDRVGIVRNTVYRWREEDSIFKEKMDNALGFGKNLINDMAESHLINKINKGDVDVIKFWLKNKHLDYIRPIIVNSLKNSVMSFKDQVIEADKELEQWEKDWMKDIEENIAPKKKKKNI